MPKLFTALSLTTLLATGCGQTGPLFMPGQTPPASGPEVHAENDIADETSAQAQSTATAEAAEGEQE